MLEDSENEEVTQRINISIEQNLVSAFSHLSQSFKFSWTNFITNVVCPHILTFQKFPC